MINDVMKDVQSLKDRKNQIELVPRSSTSWIHFPFDTLYPGQSVVLDEMAGKSVVLSPHTGAGKTPVFIASTYSKPTIIIEPRKFLQKQISEYFIANNFKHAILFGRSEYPCKYAPNAGVAPCLKKVKCTSTYYKDSCDDFNPLCTRKPCKLFMHQKEFHRYPCDNCEYISAQKQAIDVLHACGTVICNFGNFWTLLDHADNVVIDEADLFFREISTPRVINTAKSVDDPILPMLKKELEDIDTRMQTTTPQQYYALKNAEYAVSFLHSNHSLCFAYKKKNWKTKEEKIYVEINPASVNVLKDRIFGGKRLIIVTATPTDFGMPTVTYSIPQRCGIFYTPQGKLTSRELQQQPWILDNTVKEFILPVSKLFEMVHGSKKFVIHCGNIGNHATKVFDLIGSQDCILHEKGQLMQTIDRFMESDKKFLLVASAEYGADFTWCDCQFVLKVPYASLDDRMKALEKKMGKSAFSRFYTMDAISRLVQQCGRVGRGYDSFGATFIVDAKFRDVYKQYQSAFPEWFRDRLQGI